MYDFDSIQFIDVCIQVKDVIINVCLCIFYSQIKTKLYTTNQLAARMKPSSIWEEHHNFHLVNNKSNITRCPIFSIVFAEPFQFLFLNATLHYRYFSACFRHPNTFIKNCCSTPLLCVTRLTHTHINTRSSYQQQKKSKLKRNHKQKLCSLGGPQPYVPVGLDSDDASSATHQSAASSHYNNKVPKNQRRARVLCSYDAKDATELNLSGNEVNDATIIIINKIMFNKFKYLTIVPPGYIRS